MQDDEKNWKLGMFYFNPKDPAIFIKKRFGIGRTVNFGNPLGVLIFVGLLAVIVWLSTRS